MLTNQVLQKLKDEGKICLQKIIGATLIRCQDDQNMFTEIIEYIEFDNSVNNDPPKYYNIDKSRIVIGIIPVYDIYAVYAVQKDKLSFMAYYSNDELIVDTTDWNSIYNMITKGEI